MGDHDEFNSKLKRKDMANEEVNFDHVVAVIGRYRGAMINQRVTIRDEHGNQGIGVLDLTDYKSVSNNSDLINTVLHGYDKDSKAGHPMPTASRQWIEDNPHKSPLGEGLKVWDDWIAGGKKPGTGENGNAPDMIA